MTDNLKTSFKFHPLFTIFAIIALTLLWSKLYLNVHMDIDIGWLLQCLERFLAGGKYGLDFYESNPPMSFLIYLPAYPLYMFTPINAQSAVLLLFLFYIALSNFVAYKLLIRTSFKTEYIFAVISALIIIQTWAAGISFGSKDHLIFIFLIPLLLLQYLLTINKKPHIIITAIAIIMGGIAICLKPYYAVIPAIFFMHRIFITKSIVNTITSTDFIGLLIIGIAYIGFIYLFTPEYIELLPELLSIYGLDKPFPIFMRLNYLIYALIAAISALIINDKKLKYIILISSALSIACFVPYYMQQKGFFYHAIPFLSFSILSMFIAFFAVARLLLNYKLEISLLLPSTIIIILSIPNITGGKYPYLTNNQFISQPLVKAIDELAWNRTYATYDMKSMLLSLPYITDLENGSRYGHIWTIHGLSIMISQTENKEEKAAIKQEMLKYVDMFAQDMNRYKPSVITIPRYRQPGTNDSTKNYLNFLLSNKNFKKNMDNYIFEKSVEFDTTLTGSNYDPEKIVVHDIYVLKENNNLGKEQ